ncbi:MAG: RidA family protein [Opitutae bacterium]|nr:RidA family protein [Opitutae bacterium]
MNTTHHRIRHLGQGACLIFGVLGVVGGTGCAAPQGARQIIKTPDAPAAIGPYSQAVLSHGFLYVSGQIALDPKTGQMVGKTTGEQTAQVMHNLRAILAAAGLGFEEVVQTQVFLADLGDFGAMNEIYATHFTVPPARITIQAGRLPRDAKIEIAVIAAKR